MITVQGKKTSYMTRERLEALLREYEGVTIDLGAGDGLWVYEQALERPKRLFIAVDARKDEMADASARAAKNPARGGAPNALFVSASVRQMPRELARIADEVQVILPTGTLASGILEGDPTVAAAIAMLGRRLAKIRIVLNTKLDADRASGPRRKLPDVTPLYTRDIIAPPFTERGVRVRKARWMTADEVAKLETTWSKKLAHRPGAKTFLIEAKVMTPK